MFNGSFFAGKIVVSAPFDLHSSSSPLSPSPTPPAAANYGAAIHMSHSTSHETLNAHTNTNTLTHTHKYAHTHTNTHGQKERDTHRQTDRHTQPLRTVDSAGGKAEAKERSERDR